MAITPDQTAILELLLGGGQTYSELDDLLGLEEGETRSRALSALEEIGGADPDREVALGDFLLGQADPIDRADVVRHLRQDAQANALATDLAQRLSDTFPGAHLPAIPPGPGAKRSPRALGPQPVGRKDGRSLRSRATALSSLDSSQTRLIAMMGGGALVLILIVLAIAGVFSGDDAASTPSGDTVESASDDASSPLPEGQEVTRVPLVPTGNGDAAGAAIVGVTESSQPYLDLVIENLEPAPRGQAYLVWFMFDEERGYPIPTPITPDAGGSFEDRVPIPLEVTAAIARARAIEVSLSDANKIQASIETAIEENTIAIVQPGRTILRGEVPREPAAAGEQPAPGEGDEGG